MEPRTCSSSQTYFLVSEEDLEKIDSMISILGLAVGEILLSRRVGDPPGPEEERPHAEDFNAQIHLALDEAARQMELPWSHEIDF
jgi:hypothetical protein